MPNWKKIIVSGSDAVLKTVAATSLTGSLLGTASYATQAMSSSNASLATNVVGSANRILFNNGTNITTTSNNLTWTDSTNLLTLGDGTGAAGTINKLALYTSSFGGYGLGVSPAQLDYVSDGSHVFYKNGVTPTELVRITNGGIVVITGSIEATNGITGSLSGTASYATNADTLDGLDSADFVQTNGGQTITGNKSFRDTIFFGTDSADGKTTFVEQTAGLSASISIDSEANLIIQNAEDLTLVTIAQNGDGVSLASGTFTGNLTGNADTATTASYVLSATSSSFASTASFVGRLNQSVNINGNSTITGSLTVTNDLIVLGSASLQFISQSTLNIGTNIITVNTFNPTTRFGGISIIDSGSSPMQSASLLYDSVQDEFIFVHKGDNTNITSSHFLVGPQTYNDVGNEIYIPNNTILRSQGNEHVTGSNITDTGTLVGINSNTAITGSLSIRSTFATTGNPLEIKNPGYFNAYFQGTTANNQASFYLDNDRGGFASYGGFLYGGSTSNLGNIFGVSRADKLMMFADGASNLGFYIGTVTSQPFVIGTNNTEQMRITGTGNIGIGTSTPNSKLQVNGNVQITGSANNSLTVRGSGATSATSTLLTQNSSGTTTFTVRDDGKVVVGSNSATTAPGKLTIFQGTANASDGLNFQVASNDGNQLYVGATSTSNIQIGFNSAGWNFSGTSLRNTLASNNSYGSFTMAPNAAAAAGGINVQGTFSDLGLTGGFGVLALAGGNSYNDSLSMTLTTAGNGNAPGQSATLYCGRTYLISGSRNNISSIVLNSTFNQIQAISTGSITGINHIPVITSAYNYRAFDFSNTTAYTPNAAMTDYVWSRISANISASANSQQITGLDIILSGSNSAFTGVTRSALRLSTQNATDNALSVIGRASVAGTTRLSGSFNTAASGSILTVIGSGSAQPIFTVQGSQGELFSVTDSLSGSLFSVNDISGLPIMEVFSDNTILMGDYQDPMMLTTKKIVQTNSGSFIVYSIPTSSYDGAFIDYTIKSGSNARAGTIMSTWAGSSIEFTEVDTMDIGSTTAVGLTMILSGSNAVLTGSSSTGTWTIRTIIRTI